MDSAEIRSTKDFGMRSQLSTPLTTIKDFGMERTTDRLRRVMSIFRRFREVVMSLGRCLLTWSQESSTQCKETRRWADCSIQTTLLELRMELVTTGPRDTSAMALRSSMMSSIRSEDKQKCATVYLDSRLCTHWEVELAPALAPWF